MSFALCFVLLLAALVVVERAAYRTGLRVGRLRAATDLLRESNRLRGLGVVDRANTLARAAIDLERSV